MHKFSRIRAGRPPTRRNFLRASAALAGFVAAGSRRAEARRLLVIDETTGFAIGGFDPMAYYVDGRPRLGDRTFQVDWRGGTWLFTSEGNMAVFQDSPEVYAPVFGGYCAYAIAQGFPSEGNPNHFAIIESALYLFSSAAYRVAFLEGGPTILARASNRWPEVSRDLP